MLIINAGLACSRSGSVVFVAGLSGSMCVIVFSTKLTSQPGSSPKNICRGSFTSLNISYCGSSSIFGRSYPYFCAKIYRNKENRKKDEKTNMKK